LSGRVPEEVFIVEREDSAGACAAEGRAHEGMNYWESRIDYRSSAFLRALGRGCPCARRASKKVTWAHRRGELSGRSETAWDHGGSFDRRHRSSAAAEMARDELKLDAVLFVLPIAHWKMSKVMTRRSSVSSWFGWHRR